MPHQDAASSPHSGAQSEAHNIAELVQQAKDSAHQAQSAVQYIQQISQQFKAEKAAWTSQVSSLQSMVSAQNATIQSYASQLDSQAGKIRTLDEAVSNLREANHTKVICLEELEMRIGVQNAQIQGLMDSNLALQLKVTDLENIVMKV